MHDGPPARRSLACPLVADMQQPAGRDGPGRLPAGRAVGVYQLLVGVSGGLYTLIFTLNLLYQATVVGLTPFQLVLVGTVLEAVVFIAEVPTGIVADLYSRKLSIVIGLVLVGLGFVLEGSVPTFAAVLAAQVLWGVGFTFTSGADAAWITDEVGADHVARGVRPRRPGRAGGRVPGHRRSRRVGARVDPAADHPRRGRVRRPRDRVDPGHARARVRPAHHGPHDVRSDAAPVHRRAVAGAATSDRAAADPHQPGRRVVERGVRPPVDGSPAQVRVPGPLRAREHRALVRRDRDGRRVARFRRHHRPRSGVAVHPDPAPSGAAAGGSGGGAGRSR